VDFLVVCLCIDELAAVVDFRVPGLAEGVLPAEAVKSSSVVLRFGIPYRIRSKIIIGKKRLRKNIWFHGIRSVPAVPLATETGADSNSGCLMR
jgi:hypothetical protein